MPKNVSNLRKRVDGLPRNSRGRRIYGDALRSEICDVALSRRAAGERLTSIAAALGISTSMLSEWLRGRTRSSPVREVVVEVDGDAAGTARLASISIRLVGGAVVEGLSREDIVHLLKVVP